MYKFYSTEDMLQKYEAGDWEKIDNARGYTLVPASKIASGSIEVWGNPETHCFIISDITLKQDMMERYYYTERSFKVTFIEDMTALYYQNKAEVGQPRFGAFCWVNNLYNPRPWFHRYPSGTRQKCFSIIVNDRFFSEAGMHVSTDKWDSSALKINGSDKVYPELAALCMEIKNKAVSDDCFGMYFHSKAMECAALVFEEGNKLKEESSNSITQKSRIAARAALDILCDQFTAPPGIDSLAKMVGVSKGALQTGFRKIVGQSIHDYVRALRMERALSYLEDCELSIEEISRLVGYNSKIHFFNAFKEVYGCTPGQLSGRRKRSDNYQSLSIDI